MWSFLTGVLPMLGKLVDLVSAYFAQKKVAQKNAETAAENPSPSIEIADEFQKQDQELNKNAGKPT